MSRSIANTLSLAPIRHLSVAGFVALTLALGACGGGTDSGADGSRLGNKSPYTENSTDNSGVTNTDDRDNSANEHDSGAEEPVTDNPDVSTGGDATTDSSGDTTSGSDESDPVAEGGDEDESSQDSEDPSTSDDSGLLEEVVSEVNGSVRLQWDRPEYRENGDYLEGDDIGGYELRYRRLGEEDFQTVIVENGWDEEYELGELVGSYQFTIAAFDSSGLYSEFVSLSPATGLLDAP